MKSLLFFVSQNDLFAQKSFYEGGITFKYYIKSDSLYGYLSAPAEGWVMAGFNKSNSTDEADFKFFAKLGVNNIVEDRKNIGGRNYPKDESLGGTNEIRLIRLNESGAKTTAQFVIPLISLDKQDIELREGDEIWLILAFSVSDDLQHHSRVRKHIKIKL